MGNESRDQNLVHNVHHQLAKLVRGDFTMMNESNINLISPSKQFNIPNDEQPHSENHNLSKILLDDEDEDDDDNEMSEEIEDEFDFGEDDKSRNKSVSNDDDNDISMTDSKKRGITKDEHGERGS